MLEILKELVACDGVSSDDIKEHEAPYALLRYAQDLLLRSGYAVAVMTPKDFPALNLFACPDALMRRRLSGESGVFAESVVLCGHGDVVPYDASEWTTDPRVLDVRDGRAYGRGTSDMRGFLACALHTVRELAREGLDASRLPCLLITSDEETSMRGAELVADVFTKRSDLQRTRDLRCCLATGEEAVSCESALRTAAGDFFFKGRALDGAETLSLFGDERFRCALIGEATGLDAVTRHKGWLAFKVTLTGKGGHSSHPELGANALSDLPSVMACVESFRRDVMLKRTEGVREEDRPTLNLGTVRGGSGYNCICDECVLGFDIRPTAEFDVSSAMEIERYLKERVKLHEGVSMRVEAPFAPVGSFVNNERRIIESLTRLSGRKERSVAYCTEAPYISRFAPCAVMGPGSIAQAHTVDEYIEVAALEECCDFLRRLCREGL